MPALAAYIGSIFSSLLVFFAAFFTKKVAVIIAIISVLTASAVAFASVIQGYLDQLIVDTPTGILGFGLSLLPSNTDAVISVIVATHIAVYAHNWFIRLVQARNF